MSSFKKVESLVPGSKVITIQPINRKVILAEAAPEVEENVQHQREQAEFFLEKTRQEAEAMKEKTRAEIEADKEKWQQEKTAYTREACEKGYEEGYQSGEVEGRAAYEELTSQAREAVQTARQEYEAIISSSEKTILALSMKVAAKILQTEFQNQEHYTDLVREVLTEVKDQERITVYSHPADYPFVVAKKAELKSLIAVESELYFSPDSTLNRNDCIVETPYGRLDAGLDSQLSTVKKRLLEVFRENNS